MKKTFLSLGFVCLVLFGLIQTTMAAPGLVEVAGDQYQLQTAAMTQYQFRFRARTQVRVNSCVPLELDMDVDAMNIGDKTFDINITECADDCELNMTCRETEAELGVQAGLTVRNRERARLSYGFAIQIDSNETCHAQLRLSMSAAEGSTYQWAYFDEASEEWVPVESTYENGFLVAETDHFSIWTVFDASETIDFGTTAFIVVSAITILGMVLYIKKRRV
jgi:hypothetical protein